MLILHLTFGVARRKANEPFSFLIIIKLVIAKFLARINFSPFEGSTKMILIADTLYAFLTKKIAHTGWPGKEFACVSKRVSLQPEY